MIVVKIELHSAVTSRTTDLGTMVIDNITTHKKHLDTNGKKGDYRVRMYRRGALGGRVAIGWTARLVNFCKPTREAFVFDHARIAEPVQNLVTKALKELGYG